MRYIIIFIMQLLLFGCMFNVVRIIQSKIYTFKFNKLFQKINSKISSASKNSKIKNLTKFKIIFISLAIFLIIFFVIYSKLKIFIASLILSAPFLLIPYVSLKLNEVKEKNEIRKLLPVYTLNLKNHIDSENNIILAIRRTKVEEPIKSHIEQFIKRIERGMNMYHAFERLKMDVNVKEFDELISAFQVCNIHGGKFSEVLDIYSKQLSEKLIRLEKEKEKSLSSIMTLVIMIGLNLFLLFGYTFTNNEFASIFRQGLLGRILIDTNAITVIISIWFLFKMYKMEE